MTMRLLAVTPENRTGATLTEVLMSMMILSIGVLSLAAMFPIGILSSVRATQLTHSVTLKNNVASQIDLDPGIVLDPDRNHNELNGTGFDYIIDPIGSLRLSDANSDGYGNPSDQNEWVRPFGWFDQNGDVVEIKKNVPPCITPLEVMSCKSDGVSADNAQYVLEMTSGYIDENSITEKSKLEIISI